MTEPDGRVIDYVYNTGLDSSISRLSAIADDSSGSPGTVLESYQYLGLGTVVEWDHPQTGVNLTYIQQPGETNVNTDGGDQYTGLDRFGRVVDQNYTGTSTVRYQYGYDRDGDVLYRSDLVNTALSELYHANSASSGDNSSAYDLLGRLTSFSRGTLTASGHNGTTPDTISGATASQSWSLDALGNWTSTTANGTTTTRTFNSQNQTTSLSGGTAPTYDANGNSITTSGLTYVYDAWNRVVAVKSGSTTVAAYSYDALGDRIIKTESGTTTNLYFSGGGNVVEERQGGAAVTQYVWGATGGLVLRDTVSGGAVVAASRLYALTDANGDVTALVNTAGAVVERYEYTPYGLATVLTPSGTPVSGNVSGYGWVYLFQSGRMDPVTGMYLFGARDYNPAAGRWMELDPTGLGGGDLNEYRFVGNSPADGIDPSGLSGLFSTIWDYINPVANGPGLGERIGSGIGTVLYSDPEAYFKLSATRQESMIRQASSDISPSGLSVDRFNSERLGSIASPASGLAQDAGSVADGALAGGQLAYEVYLISRGGRGGIPFPQPGRMIGKAVPRGPIGLSPKASLARPKPTPAMASNPKPGPPCPTATSKTNGSRTLQARKAIAAEQEAAARRLAERGAGIQSMALSRQQALNRLAGLEDAVSWHLDKHIPETIGKAPTAVPHWRREVGGFLDEMERLANSPNVGKKTTAEWQAKISEMRTRLTELLGEE
jgi:RHS repeat-associated protein